MLFFDWLAVQEVRGWLVLRLLYVFRVCLFVTLCVPTYHVCNKYITYIIVMRLYFGRLDGCFTLVDLMAALSMSVSSLV